MYDILQLNEMLVPELKDIAESLKIDNYHKLPKQELVYKILDKQAIAPENIKEVADEAKPKVRKRKAAVHTEEKVVSEPEVATLPEPVAEVPALVAEEAPKTKEEKMEEAIRYEKNGQFQRLPFRKEVAFNVDLDGMVDGEDNPELFEDIKEGFVEDYIPLPGQYDINEYRIMEEFIYELPAGKNQDVLARTIQGRGAFRRFKDKCVFIRSGKRLQ